MRYYPTQFCAFSYYDIAVETRGTSIQCGPEIYANFSSTTKQVKLRLRKSRKIHHCQRQHSLHLYQQKRVVSTPHLVLFGLTAKLLWNPQKRGWILSAKFLENFRICQHCNETQVCAWPQVPYQVYQRLDVTSMRSHVLGSRSSWVFHRVVTAQNHLVFPVWGSILRSLNCSHNIGEHVDTSLNLQLSVIHHSTCSSQDKCWCSAFLFS